MKSLLRHFLPFGFVKASQAASELQVLGLPRGRAWRLALGPDLNRRIQRLNFNLLPPGLLAAPDWVVDLGANVGDWTSGLIGLCQPRHVLCIEPDPELASGLRSRFSGRAEVAVAEVGAGAASGAAELNVMHDSKLNSFRQAETAIRDWLPDAMAVARTIRVKLEPLDGLIPDTARVTILKIDAQGFEREVLAGAKRTLARTDAVIMEVNFQAFYQGEAGFFELDGLMRGHGFALANYSPPRGGRRHAMYADAVYLPSAR